MGDRVMTTNTHSEAVLSPTHAAYLAAFIDGEGTLTLSRYGRRENRSGVRYRACMRVNNTNLAGLEAIRSFCVNGQIAYMAGKSGSTPNHKPCFALTWNTRQIRHLLPQVLPYLLLKRRQAELLLEFVGLNSQGCKPTAETWARMEGIRAEIRTLNKTGAAATIDPETIALRDAKPSGRLALKLAREQAQCAIN